jgi:hypothetical protein
LGRCGVVRVVTHNGPLFNVASHQLLEADFKVQTRLEAALELVSQHSSIHWDGRPGHV